MKINKSYLGVFIVFVLILSSCSQARYGSLTRRVKTNNVAESKQVKPSKKSAIIISEDQLDERIVAHETDEIEIESIATEPVASIETELEDVAEVKSTTLTYKVEEIQEFKRFVTEMPKKQQDKLNKAIKNAKHKVGKPDASLSQVLVTVLIILLILALLGFLISNLPRIIHLLVWLLVLVVLVWLIMNLLG